MNKIIVFLTLLLVPILSQNAFACGIHGSSAGNDINDWLVTPLPAANQFEIRFQNFITLAYQTNEMCSCALQIEQDWIIQSAQLLDAVTNMEISTFPAFAFDGTISPDLEGDLTSLSMPPTGFEWKVLKNTIATTDSGGHNVDLVFTITVPEGTTKSDIIQQLEGKQVVAGKVEENPDVAGDYRYEPGHFQVLNIVFTAIGGEIQQIDATSLLLAGTQSITWMFPFVLSAIGIGMFIFSRKSENSYL